MSADSMVASCTYVTQPALRRNTLHHADGTGGFGVDGRRPRFAEPSPAARGPDRRRPRPAPAPSRLSEPQLLRRAVLAGALPTPVRTDVQPLRLRGERSDLLDDPLAPAPDQRVRGDDP